jgi:DNA-binding phage protein
MPNQLTFLGDESSQILALSDALLSGNGPAISKAFESVARTRGLAQIAKVACLPVQDLHGALAEPSAPNTLILEAVVRSLMRAQAADPQAREFDPK